MSDPFFSVIVPTYHRNDLLADCLDCLHPDRQSIEGGAYEVIVTDDGVERTARQMVLQQFPWARWTEGPHSGPAANRNNGARLARGRWLAFTDDDCLPDSGWLAAFRDAMARDPGYQVFEGRTYANRDRMSLAEEAPVNETGGYLWSCNFVIRRSLFESMGGFDERFGYAAMEDVEFRTRLQKRGHAFPFVAESSVCHPWRRKGGWRKLQARQDAYILLSRVHPDQFSGNRYGWRGFTRTVVKETLPALVRYRGAGFWSAVQEHLSQLYHLGRFRKKKIREQLRGIGTGS